MREPIEGVLHVIHNRKPPKGGLLAQYIVGVMQDAGQVPIEYWPPIYFVLTDQTVADRRPATASQPFAWRSDEPYQFRFKGRPKQLSPELRGHLVTVKATVEPFHNSLGGYLARPEILSLGHYVECPYHEDSYDEPKPGTGRIFCRRVTTEPQKASTS